MGHDNDDEKQHLINKQKSNLKNNSDDNNKDDVIVIIPKIINKTSLISTNKNYGSLKNDNTNNNGSNVVGDDENFPSLSSIGQQQKLTYTWKNIDVYGEVPSQQQQSKTASFIKQLKLYCLNSSTTTTTTSTSTTNKYKPFKIPIARKQLLKNVYGCAKPGELLAVMGSSGAGKTTLLNALAFRSPSGVQIAASAIRSLNGIQVDAMELRARCAYVQQEDLFIGSLTAKEHLIFQAMLRMDRKFTTSQKMRRAEEVIMELSLGKCQNTIIGTPGRAKGLSGGERKRLAFASESLTDPPILLCDEPTSGLDSFMAHSVLKVLTRLAQKGKTIILTIHQPSSELFSLFDKILLMAEGRIAFMGTAQQANTFFNNLQMPCPTNYNPADFYVQILAIVPGTEDESREKIRKICDAYACSDTGKDTLKFIDTIHEFYAVTTTSTSAHHALSSAYLQPIDGVSFEGYRASWWTQFTAILWRSWLTVLKEPLLVRVRLIQTVIVAVLIGVIFFGQQLDQDGVMNINGAIFLFLTNMTFQNVFAVINVFCAELPVFLREHRSRLYKTETYFLGKTLAECPLFLVVPFVFTSIVYPMIGLQKTFTNYFVALLIVTLIANVSTSFGYLISSASSSVAMALSIGPPVIIPFLIFGGFLLNAGSVPIYFKWLSYLSWFRYGNEALLINQWKDVQDGDILCTRSNTTCPRSGRIILETLDFDENFLPYDILALIALIIAFRLLSLLALCIRARSKE